MLYQSPISNYLNILDLKGSLNVGGYLKTFLSGTYILASTYSDSEGKIANPNPLSIGSQGRLKNPVYLLPKIKYLFIIYDSNDQEVIRYPFIQSGFNIMSQNTSQLAGYSPVGNGQTFYKENGSLNENGFLLSFIAGSSTPYNTWSTPNSGNFPNSHIIPLQASGIMDIYGIWIPNGIALKFILQDSNNALVWTVDNVLGLRNSPTSFFGAFGTKVPYGTNSYGNIIKILN